MAFSSLSFLIFFLPVLLVLYYLIPRGTHRARNALLLAAGLALYAWAGVRFLPVLLSSAVLYWACGLAAAEGRPERLRRWAVPAAAVLGLGMLGYFKYTGFFAQILVSMGAGLTVPQIALPAGISFFTFKGISYVADVRRGKIPAERGFFRVLFYVSLFPQVLSGPIERYPELAGELNGREETLERFSSGVVRFSAGLAKKAVLASAMGAVADAVFKKPAAALGAPVAWVGALAYTAQIYFDFSGYSDMAIGVGRLFGFEFPENFRYPYAAASVTDFWRRWHITLSSWFRDYVYIPLGGNRCSRLRNAFNIAAVWLLTGLWHGAAWTFIVWGLLNGAYQVFGALTLPARRSLRASLRIREDSRLTAVWQTLVTFLLTTAAWVFFRADSLPQALLVLRRVVTLAGGVFPLRFQALGMNRPALIFTALSVLTLAALDRYGQDRLCLRLENTAWRRWAFCAGLVLLTLIFGAYGPGYNAQDFVYFKF